MKASVLHEYGPPKNLKYEDFPDPQPGSGEVLVHVSAIGVNPVDWKRRSGAAKELFPVEFPGVLGFDFAGTVRACAEGVKDFAEGDRVFGISVGTYAELCAVKAAELARVPDGLELTVAGAIPLVALTGDQVIREAAALQPGQTVLIAGATGSVGRCAMFCAIELGAKVIAGVRKKQKEEALALGAIATIDLESTEELASLGFVDAVADLIGGPLAAKLLGKVKPGGRYACVTGPPPHAALHPTISIQPMSAHPHPATVAHYGQAVRDGKLKLPVDRMLPLKEAADAQAAGEKGGVGKIVLVP